MGQTKLLPARWTAAWVACAALAATLAGCGSTYPCLPTPTPEPPSAIQKWYMPFDLTRLKSVAWSDVTVTFDDSGTPAPTMEQVRVVVPNSSVKLFVVDLDSMDYGVFGAWALATFTPGSDDAKVRHFRIILSGPSGSGSPATAEIVGQTMYERGLQPGPGRIRVDGLALNRGSEPAISRASQDGEVTLTAANPTARVLVRIRLEPGTPLDPSALVAFHYIDLEGGWYRARVVSGGKTVLDTSVQGRVPSLKLDCLRGKPCDLRYELLFDCDASCGGSRGDLEISWRLSVELDDFGTPSPPADRFVTISVCSAGFDNPPCQDPQPSPTPSLLPE